MEPKKKNSPVPKEEPLFITFLNSTVSFSYIQGLLSRVETLFSEAADKKAARERNESLKEHHLEGYRLVQTKFKDQVDYIINHGVFDKDFGSWANFYLSSLREIKKEHNMDVERRVKIGDPNGDWIVGLILYNFSLFIKYYDGKELLKRCPICTSYFTVKGKYAKYCSDGCKAQGKTEKSAEA